MQYEELTYEGVGPEGALFLMQIMTDNRNRTASEIRKIFDKHNGQLGQSGSAAWAFEEKGIIKLPATAATEEQLFETAVGAGAEDLEKVGDAWVITTPWDDLDTVKTAVEAAGIPVDEADLAFLPKTPKTVDGRGADQLVDLFETLEDHDDVQNVYSDFEPSEAALSELEQRA